MRLPTRTLSLIDRATAALNVRSRSETAVRLMQMGLANLVTEGRLAV